MEELVFFKDVINILPSEIICFIQAPSLDDNEIIEPMIESDGYKVVTLTSLDMKFNFIEKIDENILFQFHYIEIKSVLNNKKLFEAWDGVEFGHFSNDIEIPNWFREKYFDEGMYHVSDEW